MITEWLNRLIVIIPFGQQVAANNLQAGMTGNIADELTYTVSLSPSGNNPATHYACNTAATSGMDTTMRGWFAPGGALAPGAKWWQLDLDGLLVDGNAGGVIGQPFTFQDALDLRNLKRIEDGI